MAWRVEFYSVRRGTSPPLQFLETLPGRAQTRVLRDIELLEEYGPELRAPWVKRLAGYRGLHELRSRAGSDAIRMFFFQASDGHFVIVHGFRKKTESTPRREIDTALARWEDYLGRQ